jgi:hypothetical protein
MGGEGWEGHFNYPSFYYILSLVITFKYMDVGILSFNSFLPSSLFGVIKVLKGRETTHIHDHLNGEGDGYSKNE